MKLLPLKPKNTLNKAYRKEKVSREHINLLKDNFTTLFARINESESEEHLKNIVSDFLKDVWYKETNEINTKGNSDLVIHNGKYSKDSVGAIIEVKRPSNKSEMISADKPNAKAMHELILYYMRERILHGNVDIKHLVVTNIYEWYIIDANDFDKRIYRNSAIRKLFERKNEDNKDTGYFYEEVKKLLKELDEPIPCTYFDLRDYEKAIKNETEEDDVALIELYKVLSPVFLLKKPFANDSNSLDTRFYAELLHIIGLQEVKDSGKKVIRRKEAADEASILENTIIKLEDKDCLRNLSNLNSFGADKKERLFNIALELCITWVNRILFMKLLEAQLVSYHKGDSRYLFLNTKTIHDFDELSNLFFQVLAEQGDKRRPHLKDKFRHVPYLNSSLFERTELERQTFDISALDNRLELPLLDKSVLRKSSSRAKATRIPSLEYLFEFLDAYDFTSEGEGLIQEQNKNLINASVLGLIFEKINGYKDGSFYTPGFITMYMCRETITKMVLQKFKEKKGWDCKNLDDLRERIEEKREANEIINSIKICDPAVGSGHFLVSALNELIAIKAKLEILIDSKGKRLKNYLIEVVNDELIVLDDEGDIFKYKPKSPENRRVQEILFHEKETIIENCLFGVDLNPNSVKICRLRLWIELLKHAYYKESSNFTELETLPNIDINIKYGNSLISRFALSEQLSPELQSEIAGYKSSVKEYKGADSKEEKQKVEKRIEHIKGNFSSEISKNDPRLLRKSKLGGELFNLTQRPQLFEQSKAEKKTAQQQQEKIQKELNKLAAEIEEIKGNKIYENAFEWRFEFPEVLDNEGNFIGFDIVLGNPPYVQLQKMGKDADALEKMGYETFARTGDIYALFYELGNNVLRKDGLLTFITSNKWMRTEYGKSLRNFFIEKTNPLTLIDFAGLQIFDSATVDTNILSFQNSPNNNQLKGCIFKDLDSLKNMSDYVRQFGNACTFSNNDSWIILSDIEYRIKTKIDLIGIPLKDWDVQINYGIKTGFNDAFIIDGAKRKELIAKDPQSDEIIRPILRGRDIKRYGYEFADIYLISTFPSLKIDIEKYPSIKEHLLSFKLERLEQTGKEYILQGETIKARKKTTNKWFETQDSISYWDDFFKQKIIWKIIGNQMAFSIDSNNYIVNNACYILTGSGLEYLLSVLNSKIITWYSFITNMNKTGVGDVQVGGQNVNLFPIPRLSEIDQMPFVELVKMILLRKEIDEDISDLEAKIETLVSELYHLTSEETDYLRSL